MNISYGPDSNVITETQGRMVSLSDAQLAELVRGGTRVEIPNDPPERGVEWHARHEVIRLAGRLSADFRDLADRIDREAEQFNTIGSSALKGADARQIHGHGAVAGGIVHAITNALSNAQIGQLVRYAAEADAYRANRMAGGRD